MVSECELQGRTWSDGKILPASSGLAESQDGGHASCQEIVAS